MDYPDPSPFKQGELLFKEGELMTIKGPTQKKINELKIHQYKFCSKLSEDFKNDTTNELF